VFGKVAFSTFGFTRKHEVFHDYDINEVDDLELYNQNSILYENKNE
jgi:hypothetical protein